MTVDINVKSTGGPCPLVLLSAVCFFTVCWIFLHRSCPLFYPGFFKVYCLRSSFLLSIVKFFLVYVSFHLSSFLSLMYFFYSLLFSFLSCPVDVTLSFLIMTRTRHSFPQTPPSRSLLTSDLVQTSVICRADFLSL